METKVQYVKFLYQLDLQFLTIYSLLKQLS